MEPLLINPTQDESLLQVMPCPPVSTSNHLGWTAIQVQHHQPPAWENSEHSMTQHVVVVHHANHTVQAERTINRRRQEEQLDRGQIVIIPANNQHKLRWDGDGDFTLLMVDPIRLAQTAYESVNDDLVEIVPQFAMLDPLIYQIGLALKAEMESDVSDRLYAESLATLLSAQLLRHYSAWRQILRSDKGGLSQRQLHLVLDFIHTHLREDLSLAALTAAVQLSPFYFMRLFKQATGMTPHQYVQHSRIEKAKQFLSQQNLTLTDIARQVGFKSAQHLSSVFHKHTGVTPKTYREMNK